METVEKNVHLNLFYHILNFDDVWITYFRSLDFRGIPLLKQEFSRDKK